MRKANNLIHENSPYLLQHAYNPVKWEAWNNESLKRAKTEDKPILLSIGYAACHWCHVMEHECFEDEQVAAIMNENFICIKLDREERPDIDQIYMDAIQNMGLNGGWPLNVFLTPEEKPFYGGTYFPKARWMDLLDKIAVAFQKNRKELEESASKFTSSVQHSGIDFNRFEPDNEFKKATIDDAYAKLRMSFDWDNGGTQGAPKFPMPVIWEWVLQYYHNTKEEEAARILNFTMEELSKGGIYDQVGGGFARYSVDNEWFAPHFEKMLYDNGQLISLYAKLYNTFQYEPFKRVVEESIDFVCRELKSDLGGFYSALDADSEGEEGKFYTWTMQEWNNAFNDTNVAKKWATFFNVKEDGNWEKDYNILYRHSSYKQYANLLKEEEAELIEESKAVQKTLLGVRDQWVRPALDDKLLCSWNALMLNALCDTYKALQNKEYLELAAETFEFITEKFYRGKKLYRTYAKDKATIDGYLEDYALTIEALINYFEISSNGTAFKFATSLVNYTIENFRDDEDGLFFYTDKNSEQLIARKKELFDNVIPSSNAIMAENLHWMGILAANDEWSSMSDQMTLKFSSLIPKEPKYLSRWAKVYALKTLTSYDIVIDGKYSLQRQKDLWKHNLSNTKVFCNKESNGETLPLFQGKKATAENTAIFVCVRNACKAPVASVEEALKQIV